jgi:AmmeMemoRadiSam system protein A
MTTAARRFTPEQRVELLSIARRAIRESVCGRPGLLPTPVDPTLRAPGAAFVTLTHGGALRGCIGYVHAIRPLAEAIAHCAASAATGDPRFSPVTARELSDLQIEISVLSPLRPAADPSEIQVGVHGLHISKDDQHGLLLPQVASELGWDRETFLRQVCVKAGLPQDAWRRGANLQVFTVERIEDGLPVGTDDL